MRVAVWSLVVALLMSTLAGCMGSDPDDGRDSDQEQASSILLTGVPTDAMLDERSLEVHPTWHVGEWWRVEVSTPYGPVYEATVVVAGERDGHIMLGMPAEEFNDVAIGIFHLPPTGPMRAIDLAYYNHDAPLVMAPFPLKEGKEWTFEWRNGETRGEVVEVDGDQAIIKLIHTRFDLTLTYDARIGTVTEISQYLQASQVGDSPASINYGDQRVLEHGFGYEGEVIVPDDPNLAILEQRLASVGPSPPRVEVEVGPSRDTMSLGLALGEITDPPGTGSYRVAATAPNGTTYEYTLGPTDGEPAVQYGVHVKDPGGTWSLELDSYGTGGALVEAISYNATSYRLGAGNG